MDTQFSSRGFAIVSDLRRSLNALDDHPGSERQQIYELLAAHLRSAAPMALLGGAADVEPLRQEKIALASGGSVELVVDDGVTVMLVVEPSGKDAAVAVNAQKAGELRTVLARVR